jgi:hypothetical protein
MLGQSKVAFLFSPQTKRQQDKGGQFNSINLRDLWIDKAKLKFDSVPGRTPDDDSR